MRLTHSFCRKCHVKSCCGAGKEGKTGRYIYLTATSILVEGQVRLGALENTLRRFHGNPLVLPKFAKISNDSALLYQIKAT